MYSICYGRIAVEKAVATGAAPSAHPTAPAPAFASVWTLRGPGRTAARTRLYSPLPANGLASSCATSPRPAAAGPGRTGGVQDEAGVVPAEHHRADWNDCVCRVARGVSGPISAAGGSCQRRGVPVVVDVSRPVSGGRSRVSLRWQRLTDSD
jgi:hypothetical protein